MKVDYVCTFSVQPRGEVRAPPPEKRTAAVRAGRRCYTDPGAGCLAPPEQRPHVPARPVSTRSTKPSGTKRWIPATGAGPGASFVAELSQLDTSVKKIRLTRDRKLQKMTKKPPYCVIQSRYCVHLKTH